MFSFAGGHLGRLQPDGPARLSPGLWLELAKLDMAKETKIDSELILVGDSDCIMLKKIYINV